MPNHYPMPIAGMIVASAVVFATAGAARATDGDCLGFDLLSGDSEVALGRIDASAARIYFVRNGSDVKGCPDTKDACRAKAFLVPGDRVIISRTSGTFVCADFVGAKGLTRSGWLPVSAVIREAAPPITLSDWIGKWSQVEAAITFRRGIKSGTLLIRGDATWVSLDPERVRRGAVHLGFIEGTTTPDGPALSFAMGDGTTLPVGKGAESDCKVWMRRLGPYLLAQDNNNCGGANVSFWGVYTRNAKTSKGKAEAN